MHQFLSFNHKIAPASAVLLPAISAAALYGRGIFTTIALYHSKPFQCSKHWQRLGENAKKINIDLADFTEEKVFDSL